MTNLTDDMAAVLRVAKLIHPDAKRDRDIIIYNHQNVDGFPFAEVFNPHSAETCVALIELYKDGIEPFSTDGEWICRYFREKDGEYNQIIDDGIWRETLPTTVFACAVKITESESE